MTTTWQSLVAKHRPDEEGQCVECTKTRRLPVKYPCPVACIPKPVEAFRAFLADRVPGSGQDRAPT